MRKLKLFLTLLMVMLVSVGNVWADEETYTFTSKSWEATNSASAAANWTSGKDGNQMQSGRGVQITTGASGANATSPASLANISKIVVTYSTNANNGVGSISLQVGSNTAQSQDVTKTGGTADRTLEYNYATAETGSIKLTVTCTTNSIYVKSVTVTYGGGEEPGGGDPDPDPDPQTGDSYELVTDASKLAIGNEIIIVNLDGDKALSTTQNTNNRGAVDVTVSNNAIVPGVNVQVLTLGKTNNHWTLYTGNGYLYAAASDKNNMKTQTTNDANGEWTISIAEDGTVTAIAQGTNTRNELRYNPNSGNPIFSCYGSTSSMGKVKIYKKAGDAPTVAKPTISGEDNFLTSTTITLTQDDADHIYYTTNGNAPTTSSTEYTAPFVLTANATVKAIAVKGTETSDVAEKAFTKATVMTVAQARAAIDAGGDLSNKFVAGVISQIDSYNSTYNSITYWISDDGTTTDQLQVYSGEAGVVKEAFASKDDLAVGDDVTIKGTLKKYNSTYEFDKNNTIEAYKPIARLAWSAASFDASLEGANSFPTLTSSVTVSYSSSNTDAATINPATGAITLKAVGSTTITASFAGNETYKANSTSYTLNVASSLVTLTYNVDGGEAIESVNVNALPNPLPTTTKVGYNFGGWFTDSEKTVEAVPGAAISENTTIYAKWLDPYTVSQAKAVIDDAPDGTANQYVAGIISQIDSYNSTYKSITYWISADGTTTDQLEVYSGLIGNAASALGKEQFSAKGDLQVGDQVVVTGTLKKYGDIYEFDKNNTIYSFNRPAPKYTVRLWNSEGWDEVYAYVWKYDEVNDVTTEPVAWPGQATSVVDGWNEFEVEEDYNIIFNNNKSGDDAKQTIDIKNITADVCYVLTGETVNTSLAVAADNDCNDRFYIAGDEALTGDNWNTTADRLENGSITFTNIAANTYKFKITNGTWKWNIGGVKVDATACDGVTIEDTDGDGNVVFTIDEAKDITITYNKATDKIVVTAVTYVEPVYKAIVASYGDKYYAMTTTLDGDGFTPLEVAVDADGNVIVNSDGEKNSILWKYTAGAETATFQDANNLYLAKGSGNTGLDLAATAAVWNWNGDDEYYYVTSGRTFLYQGDGNIFKNYSLNNSTGYSAVPALYAADKIVIRATAKFFAPASWENVYAYTYSWDEINGTTEYNGAWPGEQLTKDGDWYAISMPIGAKVIFHNNLGGNSNQTVDIPVPASSCFAWNGLENNDNPKMTVATISTCEMNYSIAGDEALTGVAEWGHTAMVNNTITYNEVAVGTYKFKISNGTWDWSLGGAYVDQTACSGVTIEETDGDGNAVFSIAIKSNITITYNPATEKISIVASAATPKEYYTKVTSADDLTAGTYLIVYEDANVAFNGGLTTLDAVSNTIDVTISEGKIEVSDQTDAAAFVIDPELGTIKSASGLYIGVESNSNGLKQNEKIYKYRNTFSIDANEDAVIAADFEGSTMTMRYNAGSNQNRFRYYTGGQQAIQLYKKAGVAKANPQLAFDQTAVEAIKDEAFTAPALSNNHNVTVSYESSATGKATVDETTGEVTIKNAGEVTIYAVSAGNDEYRESYAKYTITISAYEPVRSDLEPGRYYTVCYDKTMKEIKGASLWSFNGKDANMAYIVEAEAPYIAGTPYLIYAESDKLEAITEAVDNPVATNNNGLYGTLEEMSNTDLQTAGATHLLVNNELRPLGSGYLKANRAYVILDDIQNTTPTPSNAPGKRVRAIPMHQDAATGIDELNASEKPVKMVIDGQLYILRGEKMYDATGRLVK